MKICLISEEYPQETNFGGIATYQKRLATNLVKLGHTVSVIARSLDVDKQTTDEGVNVIRIFKNTTSNLVLDYTQYRQKVLVKIEMLIAQNMVDIIEVADWGAEAIFYLEKVNRTIPVVVKLHTPLCVWSMFNKNGLGKGIQTQMLKWEETSILNADKVISCTNILLEKLYPLMPKLKTKNIEVVPNPANTVDFYFTDSRKNSKTILFCGSTEQRKGVITLAHAIPLVMQQLNDKDIIFKFVGKDTTRNEKGISTYKYIKQIVPQCYHKNLCFLGQIDNDKLNPIYNESLMGIVPSLFDNLPYVAMEQMLTQMPIVASQNSGVKEMIENKVSGLLFNPQDENELCENIVYLFKNKAIASKMGTIARKQAFKKYSPLVIAKKMEKIYCQTIKTFKENFNQ